MLIRKRLLQNTRIFKQADSLARAGYDVVVIAPYAAGRPAQERFDGFTLIRMQPRWLSRLLPGARWTAFYTGAYRLLRRQVQSGDIVHCNDLDTLPLGLLLRRKAAIPVVYDVQDLYPDQDHIPGWLGRVLKALERQMITRVQRIIAVNDAVAELIRGRHRVDVDAVVLNCPPLDGGEEWSRQGTLREALSIPDHETVLVYSGLLSKRRGLEHTILALRELPDVCLVLLGEGPLKGALEILVAQRGLQQRVHFTEFIDHSEVPRFIQSADIGIVPYEHCGLNHYLCSPNKLFHYMMAELPVVCSDFPFLRSMVIENQIGAVFNPADPHSIAATVRRLTDDPSGMEACKQRLRKIKQRYCWEEEEKRLLTVYQTLR